MSRLLIDEPPLQVLPSLAVLIGLNEAIALQQLHYWLIHTDRQGQRTAHFRDGRWWIYNSYEQWYTQFPFWSQRTIRRVFTSLETKRLVISEQLELAERDARKWYTINYEVLERLSRGADQIRPDCPDGCGHNEPVEAANPDASIGSDWPDGSGQSGRIFHAETTSETTTETTHTPPPWQTGVWSRHDLEACRRYAQWLHDTKQGINNPEGFARSCYQTGLDDKRIDQFLADEASGVITPPATITEAYTASGLCPSCGTRTTEPCSNDPAICPLAQDKEVGRGFTQAAS